MNSRITPGATLGLALTALFLTSLLAPSAARAEEEVVSLELTGGTRFLVPAPNLEEGPDGYTATGELTLVSPLGAITIAEADLFFAFVEGSNPEDRRFDRIVGRAQVPPPLSSGYVSIPSPCMAELGYDYGRNIDLGVPLQDDTHYLYFDFDSGLSIEFGATGDEDDSKPLTLDIPAGASATLILDLTDPFYYINGALSLPEGASGGDSGSDGSDSNGASDGNSNDGSSGDTASNDTDASSTDSNNTDESDTEEEKEDGFGLGRSLNARIPFRPKTTFGIEDKVLGFDGHRLEAGTFPIGKLPLEINGYLVTKLDRVDVSNGVDPLGFGFGPSYALGGNGTLSVALSFLKVAKVGDLLSFGFDLGDASVGVEVFGDRQRAYFSGILSPDLSWIPDFMPVVPRGEVRASGYVGNDLLNTEVRLEGEYGYDLSGFTQLSGIDAGEPITITGTLRINDDGFFLEGTTSSDLPFADFSGEVRVAAFIAANPEESSLLFEGRVALGRAEVEGSVEFVTEGILLGGAMTTEGLTLGVQGAIVDDANGVSVLTGDLTYPDAIQEYFQQDLVDYSAQVRQEMEDALAELEAATNDHEIELSLRGVRRALPGICTSVINALNKVPGTVKKRWPKKFGVALPGRSKAVRHAKKQIAPHVSRFKSLRTLSQRADDATTRAALKTALRNVLKHRRCKVKVKRVGTVYNRDLLAGGRDAKVRTAIASIDRIPATSNRKIAAKEVVDRVGPRQIAHDVADQVESQVEAQIPTIEAIRFTNVREGERKGVWILEVDMTRAGETETFQVEVGGEDGFLPSIARGYIDHRAG